MRPAAMSTTRKRLLIVDDEKSIRGFLSLVGRRQFGWETEEAVNGAKAIEMLKLGEFDAILSDFNMPVLDGSDLYNWVLENRPAMITRFYLMTAYAGEDKVMQMRRENPDLVLLTKPFSAEELQRVLGGVT